MVASIVAADDIELDGLTEQVALDSIVAEDDVELDGLTEQVDRGSQPIERVASRALGLSVAARGASEVSAPAARTVTAEVHRGSIEAVIPRPLRDLRRLLSAPAIPINAEPSLLSARQHGRSLRTMHSVSSDNRFCANIVVKLADQARTSDNCLVAVRSRQRPPRPQRELRAQKVQSDY